jgi:PRTRC genetic system protein F
MYIKSNAKIHHEDNGSEIRREGLSAFISHTANVLTLPRVGQKVQTQFNAGKTMRNMAGLALNLLRKGYLEESETDDLQTLIKKGTQKWVLEHAGDLKLFDFSISMTPDIEFLQDIMYEEEFNEMQAELVKETGAYPMFMSIEPGSLAKMTIGAKLQEIEAKVPGLGKTAYYWLATCGGRTLEVYTPWMGTHLAEHIWWYGTDNQEDFAEEIQGYFDDEDDKENLANALEVGPGAWEAAFPVWATKIEKALDEKALLEIATSEPDSLESNVARIVLELIKNQDASIPDIRMTQLDPMYNGIYLLWEEHDMSDRLIDDHFQNVNVNGGEGYAETMALSPIPSKPFHFRKWMAEMEKGFKQLKNIDQLVSLIGVRCN